MMIDPLFQTKIEKETDQYGLFVIEPLAQGYGNTLGNALRRVLLTSLKGAAIVQVKINGIKHKFSTLEGLKEDIIELILNIKQIRLCYDGEKPVELKLEKAGPGQVKAGDIKVPAKVKIVNPDLVLGNLATKNHHLKVEMLAQSGLGFVPAEEREVEKLGVIPLDASFSPVQRVNFRIEATRVGRRTDLDKLILEITTDGTIKPSQALKEASGILVDYFQQFVEPKKAPKEKKKIEEFPAEVLKLTVEEIDLPTRIANTLRKGGYGTVEDLAKATLSDLVKIKNLGEKSIKIVESALAKKKINLKGK
jgi:DNA-directed RNA polymerase subunit alpha